MDSLGRRLIRALCSEKSFEPLAEKGFESSWIYDEAREAYDWIKNYVAEYGKFPVALLVEEAIGHELPDEVDSLGHVVDQIRRRRLSSDLEKPLEEAIAHIEKRDPDTAVELLTDSIFKIRASTGSSSSKLVSYRESGKDRFDDYRRVKEKEGLEGIPTKWPRLNKSIEGWVNGSFNVVAAIANTGKSWWLCIAADHAERILKKKVLFVTLEMSTPKIARRLDAIRYKLPFGKLRGCKLEEVDEKYYETGLSDLSVSTESDLLIADKNCVRTVNDVLGLVHEYNPDIVFVDGGYRFESNKGGGHWEKTLNVVTELQINAERTNIPWVVTTQFGDSEETGKEKKKGKHVRAWNVRYGKEWFIHPDVLIGLYQDEDLRLTRMMETHVLKVREADELFGSFTIDWHMGKMEFDETEPLVEVEKLPEDAGATHEVAY